MKNWIKYVLALGGVLSSAVFGFAAASHPGEQETRFDEIGLTQAQRAFNTQVYHFLQEDKIEELEQFVQSIPDCPPAGEEITTEVCTNERTDGFKYIWHNWKRGMYTWNRSDKIISIDNGMYDALTEWYKTLYRENPHKLDGGKYYDFYHRYNKTWLAGIIEETMTQLWQPGRAFDGTTWAGITYGKENYTALYVSWLAQFDDIYNQVSSHLYIYKYRAGASFVYLIGVFKRMEEISQQTNSTWLWNSIKRKWLDSLLLPETYEGTDYYEGQKQKLIIEFFNEDGWKLFASGGYQPTKWQRHTATLYGRACERMTNLAPHACERYRAGITKYGFNNDAIAQEEVKEEVARQVQSNYWKNKQKGR